MTGADPRRFLYRSLDPDSAKRLAATHLGSHDDGELYLQYSASEAFGFDDGRLKTADYHSSSGFGLRGVSGETTAFAHANEISEAAIERAAATLKLLDPAKAFRRPRRSARTRRCTAPKTRSAWSRSPIRWRCVSASMRPLGRAIRASPRSASASPRAGA